MSNATKYGYLLQPPTGTKVLLTYSKKGAYCILHKKTIQSRREKNDRGSDKDNTHVSRHVPLPATARPVQQEQMRQTWPTA
jgi:hypothetical protein